MLIEKLALLMKGVQFVLIDDYIAKQEKLGFRPIYLRCLVREFLVSL